MPAESLIVTLDGPAGSGKSTVARLLAKRLGVDFLDTGAMYRGITALALLRGIDAETESHNVIELARHSPLKFDWKSDPPRLFARSLDITDRLRDHDVTQNVSSVASLAGVRQVLVENQRRIGREHPRLVTEGRDQGSVVFPQADVKFYLDASAQVRAQRRADQEHAAGRHADVDAIRSEILNRDHKDSTRATAPLICPDDAIRIDTSEMTLEEVVDQLEKRVGERAARA